MTLDVSILEKGVSEFKKCILRQFRGGYQYVKGRGAHEAPTTTTEHTHVPEHHSPTHAKILHFEPSLGSIYLIKYVKCNDIVVMFY